MDVREGPSDAEVVARVLGGDREAFGLIVRRYESGLLRFATRVLGGRDAAADAVAESLVRAYRHLASCRDPTRLRTWLYRIVANRCKSHLARRATGDVSLDDVPPIADPADNEAALERVQQLAVGEQALATLSSENPAACRGAAGVRRRAARRRSRGPECRGAGPGSAAPACTLARVAARAVAHRAASGDAPHPARLEPGPGSDAGAADAAPRGALGAGAGGVRRDRAVRGPLPWCALRRGRGILQRLAHGHDPPRGSGRRRCLACRRGAARWRARVHVRRGR